MLSLSHLTDMEKYPRGRRGSPAKGVVRETVARVQIPLSPPTLRAVARGDPKKGAWHKCRSLFCFALCLALRSAATSCTEMVTLRLRLRYSVLAVRLVLTNPSFSASKNLNRTLGLGSFSLFFSAFIIVCLKFIDVFGRISIWIGLIITDLP